MKKNSFTLLEVIIAITVLTIAIGGSFALIQQTLIASSQNKLKLTAYYLAQEGIEIIRNIRDSNWLKQKRKDPDVSWDAGLADGLSVGESRDYIADYNDTSLSSFEDKPLNLDSSGFYSYSSGEPTLFKRKISIAKEDIPETADPNDYSLKISVVVNWSERGRSHSVQATEYLYNWDGY